MAQEVTEEGIAIVWLATRGVPYRGILQVTKERFKPENQPNATAMTMLKHKSVDGVEAWLKAVNSDLQVQDRGFISTPDEGYYVPNADNWIRQQYPNDQDLEAFFNRWSLNDNEKRSFFNSDAGHYKNYLFAQNNFKWDSERKAFSYREGPNKRWLFTNYFDEQDRSMHDCELDQRPQRQWW